MKTLLLSFAAVLALVATSFAGGNTSIANITVQSVEIKDEEIIIKASGFVRKRVVSDQKHGKGSIFGRPAQWLHVDVKNGEFVLVPYHVNRKDIDGVPGGNLTKEQIEHFKPFWDKQVADAKKLKAGDKITIGYQRDYMVLRGPYMKLILGQGSLELTQRELKLD